MISFYDRWHWVLLLLVAPFLLFPSPRWTFVLLVLPLVWLILGLIGGRPIVPTPFNGALYLLSFMLVVSIFVTYDFAVSQPKVAGLLLGIGTFYTVVRIGQHPCGWWLCALAFLGLGVSIAGVALVGTQWGNKFSIFSLTLLQHLQVLKQAPGATEGFNPNEVAGALLWVLPLWTIVCLMIHRNQQEIFFIIGERYRHIVIFAVSGAPLFIWFVFVLTQSRGGYIGLATSAMLLFILEYSRFGRWMRVSGLLFMLMFMLVLTLLWRQPSLPSSSYPNVAVTGTMTSLDSLEQRMEIWERAIYVIHDFPFTGTGMNTFRHLVHLLYPFFLVPTGSDIGHAHNEFLQAALDLGLPGLVAFLAIYLIAFVLLRQLWRFTPVLTVASPDATLAIHCQQLLFKQLHLLTLGLAGGLLAHLIYGLTDAIALGAKPGILFWILLGLIASLFIQTLKCTS